MSHSHHHQHGHSHDHAHGRGHHHAPASVPARPALEPRPNRILFVDAAGGIAGDMFLSGMIDLGVPLDVIHEAIAPLGMQAYRIEAGLRARHAITAASFTVHVDEDQPHRTWKHIDEMIASASLPAGVADRARIVFRRLAEAEGRVHGIPAEEVHFHEVGAVDAIVDIVGACACIAWLQPKRALCSPLPIGRGTIRAAHGVLPLPAPATVACLQGVPTYGVDVDGETVTPTGAAIVSALMDGFVHWPTMVVERMGFGSGSKDWPNHPNLVRMVLGTEPNQDHDVASGTHTVIETNIDDMTGELAGHAIRALLDLGALDVWVTPTTTKKGRPGLVLSVLADRHRAVAIEQGVLRETTSLGVRMVPVTRLERPREERQVTTRFGVIPVKVAGGGFGADQVKPEFDACVQAAKEHGVSVREVAAEASAAAWGNTKSLQ